MKNDIKKEYQVLDLARKTARIMLESESEVHRIEKTIESLCSYYGFSAQCFATLTCVNITLHNTSGEMFSIVERIELRSTDLYKITRITEMLNHMTVYSLKKFEEELKQLKTERTYSPLCIILAHVLGAASFVFLFQGSLKEVLVSGITGFFIALTSYVFKKIKLESLFLNALQGFVCTLVPCLFHNIGFIQNIDVTIISPLMLMVPGVAFINAIRDLFSGDLVAAQSRLLEVSLIGVTLAVGSGLALKFFYI